MAAQGTDIAALTDEQRLALEQFTSVTAQDVQHAIPVLQRTEWNAQIAIARFFDGEPEDPVVDSIPAPDLVRRQETLLASIPVVPSGRQRYDPAPRLVSAPESHQNARPPIVLSLALAPLNIALSLLSRVVALVCSLVPFGTTILRASSRLSTLSPVFALTPRREPDTPHAAAERFVRSFHQAYGDRLPLLSCSYARAYDTAKSDMKFLLVLPLANEHQHCDAFVRTVLLSDTFLRFVSDNANNILLWAGSTSDQEPYAVATALGVAQFPAAVLIVHTPEVSSTAMSIVARMIRPTSPQRFVETIQTAMGRHLPPLERSRATKREQQASRNLRTEQETAYERSLAKDRERVRAKKEAELARAKQEAEESSRKDREELHARNLRAWKAWRASQIAPEPAPDAKDAVRISVRLLSGERVIRRFAGGASIEEVYAFVECRDAPEDAATAAQQPPAFEHEYAFKLADIMPRRVHEPGDAAALRDLLGRSGNLVAEVAEDE